MTVTWKLLEYARRAEAAQAKLQTAQTERETGTDNNLPDQQESDAKPQHSDASQGTQCKVGHVRVVGHLPEYGTAGTKSHLPPRT